MSAGGGSWNTIANKDKPFDLSADHPGKIAQYGLKLTREGAKYEGTTFFKNYPAPRPFCLFSETGNFVLPCIQNHQKGTQKHLRSIGW